MSHSEKSLLCTHGRTDGWTDGHYRSLPQSSGPIMNGLGDIPQHFGSILWTDRRDFTGPLCPKGGGGGANNRLF